MLFKTYLESMYSKGFLFGFMYSFNCRGMVHVEFHWNIQLLCDFNPCLSFYFLVEPPIGESRNSKYTPCPDL